MKTGNHSYTVLKMQSVCYYLYSFSKHLQNPTRYQLPSKPWRIKLITSGGDHTQFLKHFCFPVAIYGCLKDSQHWLTWVTITTCYSLYEDGLTDGLWATCAQQRANTQPTCPMGLPPGCCSSCGFGAPLPSSSLCCMPPSQKVEQHIVQ